LAVALVTTGRHADTVHTTKQDVARRSPLTPTDVSAGMFQPFSAPPPNFPLIMTACLRKWPSQSPRSSLNREYICTQHRPHHCPRTHCTHKKCPSTPLLGSYHVCLTIHGCVHCTKVVQSSRSSRTSTSDTLSAEHFRKSRHFGGRARNQRHLPPRFRLAPPLMVTQRHLRAGS
jgi:hypothetical protein